MIILLVFKNNDIRLKADKLLSDHHQVISVSSSLEAITVLKSKNICLIITEIDIGDIDGWRLARFIRTGVLATRESVPIILITENYCERITETTARMFDINKVIGLSEVPYLNEIAIDVFKSNTSFVSLPRILVIEDTEDTADLIVRMLKHKFSLEVARDGAEGITKFTKNKYDIVLLDIQMPNMSGDQVLEVIMSLNPNQIVIAMTAHGTADIAELMLVKGAADYLQKPFKAEQLRKVCDIAITREDFLVSNEQFSAKAIALVNEQEKFDSLSKVHHRILDSLSSVVIELTLSGRITFLNSAWKLFTGYSIGESIGCLFTQFIHSSDTACIPELTNKFNFLTKVNHGEVIKNSIQVKLNTNAEEYVWCEFNFSPYYDLDGGLAGIAGTIDNISTRKEIEDNLKHLALHDTLTGLFNRHYFDNELHRIADIVQKNEISSYALLYVDLDHFKVINDTQGHHQGDIVLKEISQLLLSQINDDGTLCRIGGDEFAILIKGITVTEAEKLAELLCNTVANSNFQFNQQMYKVSCSIGISEIDGLENNADIYLQHADIAMFAAKEKGRNRYHTFKQNDETTQALKQSFDWVQTIQSELISEKMLMHFQPVIDLKKQKVAYYEALVRLKIDEQIIYPDEFIPSLEKAEDMSLLDRHVISKTFSLMQCNDQLNCVAINLSAQAFTDDRLVGYIESQLIKYCIKPYRVIFELTESASLSNITATQRMINSLNELGCAFSIDDFGTGFSTFSYLKQIPAKSVKIDGSFVKNMQIDSTDAALVKAIHGTAIALNKETVAEFVENKEILQQLIALGVHYAQGYYLGKPMGIEVIDKFLSDFKVADKFSP